MLSLLRAQIQSLIRESRSHKALNVATHTKKNSKLKIDGVEGVEMKIKGYQKQQRLVLV